MGTRGPGGCTRDHTALISQAGVDVASPLRYITAGTCCCGRPPPAPVGDSLICYQYIDTFIGCLFASIVKPLALFNSVFERLIYRYRANLVTVVLWIIDDYVVSVPGPSFMVLYTSALIIDVILITIITIFEATVRKFKLKIL